MPKPPRRLEVRRHFRWERGGLRETDVAGRPMAAARRHGTTIATAFVVTAIAASCVAKLVLEQLR